MLLTADSSPEMKAELKLEVCGRADLDFDKIALEFCPTK